MQSPLCREWERGHPSKIPIFGMPAKSKPTITAETGLGRQSADRSAHSKKVERYLGAWPLFEVPEYRDGSEIRVEHPAETGRCRRSLEDQTKKPRDFSRGFSKSFDWLFLEAHSTHAVHSWSGHGCLLSFWLIDDERLSRQNESRDRRCILDR